MELRENIFFWYNYVLIKEIQTSVRNSYRVHNKEKNLCVLPFIQQKVNQLNIFKPGYLTNDKKHPFTILSSSAWVAFRF